MLSLEKIETELHNIQTVKEIAESRIRAPDAIKTEDQLNSVITRYVIGLNGARDYETVVDTDQSILDKFRKLRLADVTKALKKAKFYQNVSDDYFV